VNYPTSFPPASADGVEKFDRRILRLCAGVCQLENMLQQIAPWGLATRKYSFKLGFCVVLTKCIPALPRNFLSLTIEKLICYHSLNILNP
jgi:hypothetical protein